MNSVHSSCPTILTEFCIYSLLIVIIWLRITCSMWAAYNRRLAKFTVWIALFQQLTCFTQRVFNLPNQTSHSLIATCTSSTASNFWLILFTTCSCCSCRTIWINSTRFLFFMQIHFQMLFGFRCCRSFQIFLFIKLNSLSIVLLKIATKERVSSVQLRFIVARLIAVLKSTVCSTSGKLGCQGVTWHVLR